MAGSRVDLNEPSLPHGASAADREAVAALVQIRLDTAKVVSASPPHSPGQRDAEATLQKLEAETDARVEFLHFLQSEARTYDEWLVGKSN